MAVGLALLTITAAAGQAQCADFARDALNKTAMFCGFLSRNSACYGNEDVLATFSVPVDAHTFTRPADVAPVDVLDTLVTAGFDASSGVWGIAVLNVQANVPGTLPGQAVTMLLVGDVSVRNRGGMTAFQVTTGIGSPSCARIPPSSLTIQSPRNAHVTLNINGADFTLGSTATFQALDQSTLRVSTVEGRVYLADGSIVPRGYSRDATLNESGEIVPESWSAPQPMEQETAATLDILTDVPRTLLADSVAPLEPTLPLNAALSLDVIAQIDPYLLEAILQHMAASGLTSDALRSMTTADLEAYVRANLDDFVLDTAFVQALGASFGLSQGEIDALLGSRPVVTAAPSLTQTVLAPTSLPIAPTALVEGATSGSPGAGTGDTALLPGSGQAGGSEQGGASGEDSSDDGSDVDDSGGDQEHGGGNGRGNNGNGNGNGGGDGSNGQGNGRGNNGNGNGNGGGDGSNGHGNGQGNNGNGNGNSGGHGHGG